MVELEYMHVCDYACVGEGGKHCIIGIFDNINAANFPMAHPYMSVAIKFQGQQHARIQVQVELSKPNGEVLAKVGGEIAIGPEGGAMLNLNLVNVVFPEAGRYMFKVKANGRTLVSHSIRAQLMKVISQTPAPQAH